ncbi:MAG: hypothetical protein ACREHG_11225 [Candidatus Saccharimonadales bacterium]
MLGVSMRNKLLGDGEPTGPRRVPNSVGKISAPDKPLGFWAKVEAPLEEE